MWSWIQTNADVISAFAAVATLAVWALYLQLIYDSFRRTRRSKILINRGAGHSVDARCIVSNMSAEPIYLEAVRLTLEQEQQEVTCSLSDLEIAMQRDGADRRAQWMQGPLATGEMIDIGTFRSLVDRAFEGSLDEISAGSGGSPHPANLTVLVVATLTSEERLVAAKRQFRVITDGKDLQVQPRALRAAQIRSGSERKEIEEQLKREIDGEWRSIDG